MKMTRNKKTGRLPNLRFPEFRDAGEWEEKKLGEISSFYKGKNISKSDLVFDGKTKCIRYGELYTHYNEVIDVVISRTNLDPSNLFLSMKNDVIIPSSGETKEDIAKASCVLQNGIALGGDLNVIRTKENGIFLSYYLNSTIRKQIAKVAQGDTVVHLYPSQLKVTGIMIPRTLSEQTRIADCLSSLDELITAEVKKLDRLKAHKKALMQNLFPAEGETMPKLRFPEFRDAGEWEEKELGSLSIRRNKRNKDNIKKVLTNSAVDGVVDQRMYFEKDIANQNNLDNYLVVEFGDYVYNPRISSSAPVGPISKNKIGTGVMSPIYTVFRFNNQNNDFFYHYFKTSHWHNYLHNISNTGARHDRMSLNIIDFMKMPLPYPPLPEQTRIADCLSSLDELITAETEKIELLKKHKKGMMQQLFPAAEETTP